MKKLLSIFLSFFMLSCASVPVTQENQKEELTKRAQLLYKAYERRDAGLIWELSSRGLRSTVTKKWYIDVGKVFQNIDLRLIKLDILALKENYAITVASVEARSRGDGLVASMTICEEFLWHKDTDKKFYWVMELGCDFDLKNQEEINKLLQTWSR